MAQRWRVVYAQAACERAGTTRPKVTQREDEAITKARLHLQAQRFPTPEAAHAALAAAAKHWPYPRGAASSLTEHPRDARKGRPTPRTPRKASMWQIQAHVRPADEGILDHQHVRACFVPGTHISASAFSDLDVIAADKHQARVEGGFRWLKDPRFVVSSWFVKKPSRLEGLLLVMPLAGLVYSVRPRRLRQP
jgi:hypothetical protein